MSLKADATQKFKEWTGLAPPDPTSARELQPWNPVAPAVDLLMDAQELGTTAGEELATKDLYDDVNAMLPEDLQVQEEGGFGPDGNLYVSGWSDLAVEQLSDDELGKLKDRLQETEGAAPEDSQTGLAAGVMLHSLEESEAAASSPQSTETDGKKAWYEDDKVTKKDVWYASQ